MARIFDNGGAFGWEYEAPAYTIPDTQVYQEFDFYELPYNPNTNATLTVNRELTPHDEQFFGLPVGPVGVSRVGPTASAIPRAAMNPNVRAGFLFSGRLPTQANFRAGRGYMAQRGGVLARMQEAMRRRRRKLSR